VVLGVWPSGLLGLHAVALFFDQTVACFPLLTTEGCEILAVEEDAYEGQGMQFSNVLMPQTLLSMALPDRLVFFC